MMQKLLIQPFLKSVFLGSIAGAAPLLIATGMLAIPTFIGSRGGGNILLILGFAILPLMIAIPVVLSACVIIGLPVTIWLRYQGWENAFAYTLVGAVTGFIWPIAILLLMSSPSGYWIAILGAVSGAVTGRTWWLSARKAKVSYGE